LWRLALRVLAGLDPRPDGLHIRPCLPPGAGPMHLRGIRWRGAELDIRIDAGNRHRLTVEGRPATVVGSDATGALAVHLVAV
jgi:trehalose/maltose hydrolase-like predicted phosphorylase